MEIKGELRYLGLILEWKVDGGDVWQIFLNFLRKNNGKKAVMGYSLDGISLTLQDDSDTIIKFEEDDDGMSCLLDKQDDFGFSNVFAYVGDTLERVNARTVCIEMSDTGFSINAAMDEKVNEIYYTHNNSCAISDDMAEKICQPGTENACVFLSASGDGWGCLKFDSCGRSLLYRIHENDIRATRIGNCRIAGRKDNTVNILETENNALHEM